MSGVEELELAEAAFSAKDFESTIRHARAALATGLDLNEPDSERGEYWPRPQTSSCEILLGMALLETGQHDEALAHLDRAVALDRDSKRAWANRGHLRRERGEQSLALADFDEALKRDPSYAFARFRRAQTLLDLARTEEAEAELAQILMLNPYDAAPLALWQALRAKRGLASDSSALPAPREYFGLFQRGLLFMQHGEPARALLDYDAAYALNPQVYVRANRAVAHEQLGNLEAARADIEAYLETDPTHANMRAFLNGILDRLAATFRS